MSRRMQAGDDLGQGWTLAAYRAGSEEVQADGSIRRNPPHLRAERRVGDARVNLTATSESGILERIASWSRDRAARKAPPEPIAEPEPEKGVVKA